MYLCSYYYLLLPILELRYVMLFYIILFNINLKRNQYLYSMLELFIYYVSINVQFRLRIS